MDLKAKEIMNMTLPQFTTDSTSIIDYEGDMVIPVFKSDFDEDGNIKSDELEELDKKTESMISRMVGLNKFNGDEESILTINLKNRDIILIGCGKNPSFDRKEYMEEKNPGNEKLRMIGIKAINAAKSLSKEEIAVVFRGFDEISFKFPLFIIMTDGFIRACYQFDYKEKEDEGKDQDQKELSKVNILVNKELEKEAKMAMENGKALGKAVNFARAMVDEPSNQLYPATYVELVKELFKDSPCDIEVWDFNRIRKEGMGLLESVGRGNEGHKTESRFIVIRSRKKSKNGKVGLVGKGVTFDTGGYNLKPRGAAIAKMKKDMGGSAAIIGATKAILDLDVDIELVTAIPMTENSVSRSAIKPGDVVKAYNGKTVEILNTDAEGRLAMADALGYLSIHEKPDYMLDAATLTGSCYIALGLKIGGFMSNNPEYASLFGQSALDAGESFWELPLPKKYRSNLDGTISDLTNINNDFSGWGGALTAGLFLQEFIGECKNWIHIDMSAPTYALAKTYLGDGALGFSVGTIVRYIEKLADKGLS
jgi:leucyl aminopeptidase